MISTKGIIEKGSIDIKDVKSINFDYDSEDDSLIVTIQVEKEFLKKFGKKLGKKIEKTSIEPSPFNLINFSSSHIMMFD